MRSPAGFISASFNPLKNPNAPTIGTATQGNASASVAFTAPANPGGSAITSYIVVSTPGVIVGTGASSPVTVSGLTNGTAYTFQASAVNSYGQGALSAASNSVTPVLPPVIGEAYQGGYYAGQISTTGNGIATHNLVVGPKASAQTTASWKSSNSSTAGTSSVIDGPANSTAMNDASHPAAQFCKAVTSGGFSDWYMPAKNELEVCYFNLKPRTTTNYTSSGKNANAVPARASNYSGGTPAQTSAVIFQYLYSEAFDSSGDEYWSSTQATTSQAWRQAFNNGGQYYNRYKTNPIPTRAIRRVPV